MTALKWIDDQIGYRCPSCFLFVAVPKREPDALCPRCPHEPTPLVEELTRLLRVEVGLDETDAPAAAEAVCGYLDRHARLR